VSFVDSLPTDLAMKALVEAKRLLTNTHLCHVCEDVAATALCLQCGDFFSPPCTKGHKKSTVSKHHIVEELSTLTPDKLKAKRGEQTCSSHPEEASKVFCPRHDTAVCLLCATTSHRECKGVVSLDTKVAEAQKSLQDLVRSLVDKEAKVEHALSDLDQHLHQVRYALISSLVAYLWCGLWSVDNLKKF
jgi:hypothetical protein